MRVRMFEEVYELDGVDVARVPFDYIDESGEKPRPMARRRVAIIASLATLLSRQAAGEASGASMINVDALEWALDRLACGEKLTIKSRVEERR